MFSIREKQTGLNCTKDEARLSLKVRKLSLLSKCKRGAQELGNAGNLLGYDSIFLYMVSRICSFLNHFFFM